MFFADFTKLKIDTDYNYLTKHFDLHMRNPMPVAEIKTQLTTALQNEHIEKTTLPVLYDFNVTGEVEKAEIDELVGYILSLANIIVPVTLKFLETGNGYKRERRLDVPVKLKPLHTSFSCIKGACNNEILTPILNIQITFGNIKYLLCDGREVDEVKKEDSSDE